MNILNKLFLLSALSFMGVNMKAAQGKNIVCKDGVCSIEDRSKYNPQESGQTNLDDVAAQVQGLNLDQEEDVIEIMDENFDEIIKNATKPLIIDFYAVWCGPCKTVKPLYLELAKENKDWIFACVDFDKSPKVVAQCNISSMPTFVVFKNGQQWGSFQGAMPKELLRQEIEKLVLMDAPVGVDHKAILTQFLMAIASNNMNSAKKLIEDIVDINATLEMQGITFSPILMSINIANKEVIDMVLSKNPIFDESVQTIVRNIIEKQTKEFLVYQDTYSYTKDQIALLKDCQKFHSDKLIPAPEELNSFISFILRVIMIDDSVAIDELIAKNYDINFVFELGVMRCTPLYFAILANKRVSICKFIQAGATLDIVVKNIHGFEGTIEEVIKKDIENHEKHSVNVSECLDYVLSKLSKK